MSHSLISAKVIAASESPRGSGYPSLYSVEILNPTNLLAEVNTHRDFSRSSSSFRAKPVNKLIADLRSGGAFVPSYWQRNQPGMEGAEEIDEQVRHPRDTFLERVAAGRNPFKKTMISKEDAWLQSMEDQIGWALSYEEAGYHKQIHSRLLTAYAHTSTIITSSKWENFFKLRSHHSAEPHIHELSDKIQQAMTDFNNVRDLSGWQWHLPYALTEIDPQSVEAIKSSVAGCARVSYGNHSSESRTIEKDIALYDTLLKMGHMSPFEHQARYADAGEELNGNFNRMFTQHRKIIEANHPMLTPQN